MASHSVRVRFDPEADILYIRMKNHRIADTRELADDIYADVDGKGRIVGIEIWRASHLALPAIAKPLAERVRKLSSARIG